MYYGKHYYAYFYSEKYDTWFRFDDATVQSVGNYRDLVETCVKGKGIPRMLFYERIDILTAILTEGSDREQFLKQQNGLYFAESNMAKNNFWNGRNFIQ
jgi:hypothetical protein